MEQRLHPDVRLLRGPAGAAIYDLRDGSVYAVPPALAPLADMLAARPTTTEFTPSLLAAEWLRWAIAADIVVPGNPQPAELHAVTATAPRLVWMEITGRCNYTCVHCYADADPGPHPSMPAKRWRDLIVEARACGFPTIQFTGGDPLMHPNLVEFVELAHAQGFDTVEVYTNGSLVRADVLDRFARLGTHMAISFYSPSRDTYNAVTGGDGFDRAVATIRGCVARQIPLRIGLIDVGANHGDIGAAIEFLTDLGVHRECIRVDGVRPTGRGRDLAATACGGGHADEGFVPIGAVERRVAVPLWREPLPVPTSFRIRDGAAIWNSCWAGEIAIDPSGTVFPCIFARSHALGQVQHHTLAELLAAPSTRQAWASHLGENDDCSVCEFRVACFDCRAITENMTGRGTAKPPSCIYDPYRGVHDWDRVLRQRGEEVQLGGRVQRRGTLCVTAESEHEVLIRDAVGQVAAVDPLSAAVWEMSDGAPLSEIADAAADIAGAAVPELRREILIRAWELARRGLVVISE